MPSPNSENSKTSDDNSQPVKWFGLRTIQLTSFEQGLLLSVIALLLLLAVPRNWLVKSVNLQEPLVLLEKPETVLSDTLIRFPLDINTASPELLQIVPGIGPKLAQRIVEARTLQPFSSHRELIYRVRGIGQVSIERIAPYLTVDTTIFRGKR